MSFYTAVLIAHWIQFHWSALRHCAGGERLPELESGWRFDLPTEAEWELAARISDEHGTSVSHGDAWFDDPPVDDWGEAYEQHAVSWGQQLVDVGAHASPIGVFDMLGGRMEWTRDHLGPLRSGRDPRGATSGLFRVLKGGQGFRQRKLDRIGSRVGETPLGGQFGGGAVRLVLVPKELRSPPSQALLGK